MFPSNDDLKCPFENSEHLELGPYRVELCFFMGKETHDPETGSIGLSDDIYYYRCKHCAARGPIADSEEEAKELWLEAFSNKAEQELEILYNRIGNICKQYKLSLDDPQHQDITTIELFIQDLVEKVKDHVI